MNKEKGIIYIMSTVVNGLIKIGQTKIEQFNTRMNNLERNGYSNITGLKRVFAIEVDEYTNKEKMLHAIFNKSRIGDSELFALDINIVTQLLSSFDGKVIYSEDGNKTQTFTTATEKIESKSLTGIYYFIQRSRSEKREIRATVKVEQGTWILLKNSTLALNGKITNIGVQNIRQQLQLDKNGILKKDFNLGECTPSFAAQVVSATSVNGWICWKDENGNTLKDIMTTSDNYSSE